MIPVTFAGMTHITEGSPEAEKRLGLPVTAVPFASSPQGITTCWQPDAGELAILNAGGVVVLHLFTLEQPAVSMTAHAHIKARGN